MLLIRASFLPYNMTTMNNTNGDYVIHYKTEVEDKAYYLTLPFDSHEDRNKWHQEMVQLKKLVNAIHKQIDKKDETWMNSQEGLKWKIKEFTAWLQQVRAFLRKWGEERVPLDIRIAINDVENNLPDETVTDFGEDNGGYEVPAAMQDGLYVHFQGRDVEDDFYDLYGFVYRGPK